MYLSGMLRHEMRWLNTNESCRNQTTVSLRSAALCGVTERMCRIAHRAAPSSYPCPPTALVFEEYSIPALETRSRTNGAIGPPGKLSTHRYSLSGPAINEFRARTWRSKRDPKVWLSLWRDGTITTWWYVGGSAEPATTATAISRIRTLERGRERRLINIFVIAQESV